MSFIEARLLDDLAYGFSGGPTWRTLITTLRNRHERRNVQAARPQHKFQGSFDRRDRQVLAVTHLPQVAACADHHLVVSKQQTGTHTSSSVAPLHDEPRVAEIARMLGGERASATSLAHAREMLGGGTTHTAPPARTQPKKAAKVAP